MISIPEVLPALGDDVLVVSGLPRSGTSLLMQMLQAGGVEVLTDGQREADEDNPRGYLEFEPVKSLLVRGADTGWINRARGRAVKVVVPLVAALPAGCRYRVILVERDYAEILESQARMLARRGARVEDSPDRRNHLASEFAKIMDRTLHLLRARADVRLLVLRHQDILDHPAGAAHLVNAFAGSALDTGMAARAVDPELHRSILRPVVDSRNAPLLALERNSDAVA